MISVSVDTAVFYDDDTIELYKTYVLGKQAWLLGEFKPLPSFFRVHWRVLNIDGFHYTLRFEPVKYKFTMESRDVHDRIVRQPL
jgi:hypothetical protein